MQTEDKLQQLVLVSVKDQAVFLEALEQVLA